MKTMRKYDVSAKMTIQTPCGDPEGCSGCVDTEIELYGVIASAEPDVGIMGPYIDDWWTEPLDISLSDTDEECALRILNEAIGDE